MHALWVATLVLALAESSPGDLPAGVGQARGTDDDRISAELASPVTLAKPDGNGPRPPTVLQENPAAPGPVPPSQAGAPLLARLALLPDISATGMAGFAFDSLDAGALSPRSGPVSPAHAVTPVFQELELGLQSIIDPYLRVDAFLAFASEGVEVREALITTLWFPFHLEGRAGTFLTPFGRLNWQHPHQWEFVEAPLALDRLLAEGQLKGPGIDLAWLAPLPWFADLHLYFQKTRPAGAAESQRTLGLRLAQFVDLGERTEVGLGLSAARLEQPVPGAWLDLAGADLYVKFRPGRSLSYLALQGEAFLRRASVPGSSPANDAAGYVQAVWRSGPYLAYGLRHEVAPAAARDAAGLVRAGGGTEQRTSALVSFMPTEFHRPRLQLGWDRLPGGRQGFEALLQWEFAMGSHGIHPF